MLVGLDVAFCAKDSAYGDAPVFIEAASNSFGGGAADEPDVEKKKGRMGAKERARLIGSLAILLRSIPILINKVLSK